MSERVTRKLQVTLTFTGEMTSLEKTLLSLGRTCISDVMIGTWPQPEKPNPGRDLMVRLSFTGSDRSPLEGRLLARKFGPCPVMVETLPLPE